MHEHEERWEASAPPRRQRLGLVAAAGLAVIVIGALVGSGDGAADLPVETRDDNAAGAGPDGAGGPDGNSDAASADGDGDTGGVGGGGGGDAGGVGGGGETAEAVGAWAALPPAPDAGRRGHALVWTGACSPRAPADCGLLLGWGGTGEAGGLADGAALDLAEGRWRSLPAAPRHGAALLPAVWTGVHPGVHERAADLAGELVVWGATAADHGRAGTRHEPRGVAYAPAQDRWRVLPEAPITTRTGHTLTWTGREVVAWGGRVGQPWEPPTLLADGAAYDPGADRWRPLPEAPLAPRTGHAAAARSDGAVAVFGGHDATGAPLPNGAVYDPDADQWTPIPPPRPPLVVSAPPGRFRPALSWRPDGSAIDIVGPWRHEGTDLPLVATYHVDERRWAAFGAGPLGLRTDAEVAREPDGTLLVWGGRTPTGGRLTDGARRSFEQRSWERLAPGPAWSAVGTAVWTDEGLHLWGGETADGMTSAAARLDIR